MVLFDGKVYYRNPTVNCNQPIKTFQLIDFQTNNTLKRKEAYGIIQYSKWENDDPKLKLGDRYADFFDIHSFYTGSMRKYPVVLFLDRKIKLEELKELYFFLSMYGVRRVYLVTAEIDFGKYCVVYEHLHFWEKDLIDFKEDLKKPPSSLSETLPPYSKEAIPPPSPSLPPFSRAAFIQNEGEIISIQSIEALEKLQALHREKQYIFQIDSNLSLLQYLKISNLIRTVSSEKNLNIKIEIV